jgi:hypothetical protein
MSAHTRQVTAPAPRYCIRLRGDYRQLASVFAGLDVTHRQGVVAVSGEFDQAGLHGVLERSRILGCELIDVYRPPSGLHRAAGHEARR